MNKFFKVICIVSIIANLGGIQTSLFAQTNVAFKKPVKVDSQNNAQPAWKAVDGLNYSNVNRWVSDNNGYPHWIEVDLESDYQIEKIKFNTGEFGYNYPINDYQLQMWDGTTWVDIVSKTGNSEALVEEKFSTVITSKIRLYASKGEGKKLMLYEIEIFADINLPPEIDEVQNPTPIFFDWGIQSIALSGITDGNIDKDQILSLTAKSSNTAVISDLEINYSNGSKNAILTYSPLGIEGYSVISVLVKDNGGNSFNGVDSKQVNFITTVLDPTKNYPPTINPIPNQVVVSNAEIHTIDLIISDGNSNKTQSILLKAKEIGGNFIDNIETNFDENSGLGSLKFIPNGKTGNSEILLTIKDNGGIENNGNDSTQVKIKIEFVEPAIVTSVSIDYSKEYQTIQGFGGFGMEKVAWANPPYYTDEFIDMMIDDLGLTILRLELAPDFELVNDNDDPNVFNWEVFKDGLKAEETQKWFDYLRDIADKGPEKLIISSWTPPAWMKTNGIVNNGGRLIKENYAEYAEYIVAYIKLVKEESGLDVYALSLQNEPTFIQPYNSCQYTPAEYVELIKVVGRRFITEGINTKLYYPEEVFVRDFDIIPWMNALNNDPEAIQYVDIMALHGYDGHGINQGSIGNDLWVKYWSELANNPTHPKEMWMTETSGNPNTYESALNITIGLSNAITYGNLSAWVYWTLSGESSIGADDPSHTSFLLVNGEPLFSYYTFKQYYRYVRPDAVRVSAESLDVDVLVNAFKNPTDKSISQVFINRTEKQKILQINTNFSSGVKVFRTSKSEKCIEVKSLSGNVLVLPPKSITTIYDLYDTDNNPPTLDQPKDTIIHGSVNEPVIIRITGISDGNPDMEQQLTITAQSLNTAIIAQVEIEYIQGNDYADLKFFPVGEGNGSSQIQIIVQEVQAGEEGDIFSKVSASFDVTLLRYVNHAPEIDDVEDLLLYIEEGDQIIELTGISDGDEDIEQLVTVNAITNKSEKIGLTIEYNGTDKAWLSISPLLPSREATIYITVKDDGGHFGEGLDTKVVPVKVEVKSGFSPTFIASTQKDQDIRVYPNPLHRGEPLHIDLENKLVTIRLTDIKGNKVLQKQVSNQSVFILDNTLFDSGCYILSVITNSYTQNIKLIIE